MDVAEITKSETGERARLLRVDSYAVTLDLTGSSEVFRSTSVIRFSCTEPGAASYVDLIAERVHAITLNGRAVDPDAARGDGRIALTGLAADNELTVIADCRYSRDGTGLHRAVDPADQKVYTYTKFEPAYARTVYANFEQPDLKASFTISVLAPAHWRVLSNQPLAGQSEAAGGALAWLFRPTPRLSTYLFAVAAGEYEVVTAEHTTILHEMAHMWFGDLVTMRWWDDLWLNESFAEFCAALASSEATRYTGAWTTFATSRKAWGYGQDQLPSTHPVAASVETLSEAIANFDGISYAKGASVLRQLVALIGRESFFAGITAYFAEHGWGNATLADWLATLGASSGRDLSAWSRAWLETAGPSTLRAEFEVDDSGRFTSMAVRQEAADGHPGLRPHRIAIGLYEHDPAAGTLTRRSQVPADVDGARTEIPALAGAGEPDLLLLNDDDLTYALLRFDERSIRTLTTSIGELTDSLARAVCWNSVLDMARQAELSIPAVVTMLAGAMAAEPSVAALEATLENCRQLLRTLADPAWVPQGRDQLAAVALRLLATAAAGSDHQLAWAQLLAWTATSPDQLAGVAGLLDGAAVPAGLAVGAELRWTLLQRLAAAGRAGDAEIDAELARDGTDSGQRSAAACRAAIGDAAHKAAAWALLTESADLPADLLRAVAGAFWQPEQAALLTPYTRRYFEVLPRVWATSGGHLRVARAAVLFPVTAAGPGLLGEIDAFLAAQPRDAGLARVLSECRDQVERAIRSRARAD